MSSEAGLHVERLTVRYGGVVANRDVSLRVEPGQVSGLIGPNGAGKTSFVDAVSGFAASTGRVHMDGRRIDRLPPHRRVLAGLARTWQAGELFATLTVSQNVEVAANRADLRALARDVFLPRRQRRPARVDEVLELMGLLEHADVPAGELPLGHQKLVGVARALANPCSVVLMDEPAAGLDRDEGEELRGKLRDITAQGIGILLIDHDMTLVLNVCHTVDVLAFGEVIFSGTTADAMADDAVIESYLGRPKEETRG